MKQEQIELSAEIPKKSMFEKWKVGDNTHCSIRFTCFSVRKTKQSDMHRLVGRKQEPIEIHKKNSLQNYIMHNGQCAPPVLQIQDYQSINLEGDSAKKQLCKFP